MNKLEGGRGFPVRMARYMVEHSVTMEDGSVPVFTGNFLICEVGAGHLDESAPGAFNDNVGALYFVGGCDDLGLVVVYPSEELSPDDFLIKVSVESVGKIAYVSAGFVEGVDDIILCNILEAVKPAVFCGNIN